MDEKNVNPYFMSLVMMFGSACWQHLGKVPNPATGKTECDLENAQFTIDLMRMISEKTKGNLSSEEEKLLKNTIADLELNYADEVNKKAAAPKKEEKPAEQKPDEQKKTEEIKQ
jgi:hypothetical protein